MIFLERNLPGLEVRRKIGCTTNPTLRIHLTFLRFRFRAVPVGEKCEVLTESSKHKSYIDFNIVYHVSSFKRIHAGNIEDFH